LEQLERAVFAAPIFDVIPIQARARDGDYIARVDEVLLALSMARPAKFRDDDIFGRR
jgi:hypothetical protein